VNLLVAGSIALDSLEGPFGSVTGELGGSALYFSLAASLVRPVEVVAPVGRETLDAVKRVIGDRPIDVSRLSVLDVPTYRWTARQESGSNLDLGSVDGIYDRWEPDLPEEFEGWAFVGSMRPDRQLQAAQWLRDSADLLAGDSMRSYVGSHLSEAERVLGACGWFSANLEELRALGGDPERPQRFRRTWSLDGLVVKAGAGGCTVWTDAGSIHLPALTGYPVVDVTGAGDALAGGLFAAWLESGGLPSGLRDALAHGIACASITISEVGLSALARATPEELADRVEQVLAAADEG
jgi:sugar/nucleoside kinase (ribokinase family)